MTSGTRSIVPPQRHVHVSSSMYGLCNSCGSRPAFACNSALRSDALACSPHASQTPDRQRRAPVAAARQVPVDQVLQEVAHAARRLMCSGIQLTDCEFAIICSLTLGRVDEPAVDGVVHERRIAAPAVRIAVFVLVLVVDQAARDEIFDDVDVECPRPCTKRPAKSVTSVREVAR